MTQTALSAKDLFLAALELPQDARPAWLDEACSGDAGLQRQVAALLRMHDEPDSLLDQPRIDLGMADASFVTSQFAPTVSSAPIAAAPGTTIGTYKLREQIGEGGMGIVYVADQERPVRRRVALKLIKPGMDTRDVIARFEAERQALALMDHPNIARVLEAGATDTGRPYFVMELVRGIPITEYLDRAKASLRERLELFVQVCQAVQHAHQKGIIHRDLKPTNVLVAQHDGVPVPKVIDFGVAKAINQRLSDHTVYTQFSQIVGTPVYMSPEQAQLNAIDVDTRSDVYSLGVLLYELLTGATPFDKETLSKVGFDEMRRMIREDVPPRPSQRVSTLAARAHSTVVQQRGADDRQRTGALRGELDWIVMKALEKDRNQRYESAGALARDVERHLRNEPVQACPPSNWYRFRKLARRNRALFMTASVVAVAILTAVTTLAVSSVLVWRAKDELAQNLAREQISGAQHALSTDDLGQALKLLNACPEEFRGWEWRYLMRLCRVQPLVISDNIEINGLAFSPDGERIACACGNGIIKIRDSRTGDVVGKLENAHTKSIVSVTFHPDGRHLASVGADQLVKVWDPTTEKELFTAPCDIGRRFGTAYTVAFSADGRQLAAASEGAVRIWDWKGRRLLHTFPKHNYNSIPVAFSPDGRRLATGTPPDGVKLWDVETERLLRIIPAHHHPVSALAFSPDGIWLVSASFDRTVRLSNSTTGAMLLPFEGHTGNVECVAFSSHGNLVASSGEDKVVRVWDAKTGREVLTLRGHSGRCACVAFSPDGQRLASASIDRTIRIWDATPLRGDEHEELQTIPHDDEIRSVAFSPDDSHRVASAGHGQFVNVWDAETDEKSAKFNAHTAIVFSLVWQPDGQRIAMAGWDGRLHTVQVWDTRNETIAFALPPGRNYCTVAFSTDGRHLVTGSLDGDVEVWDAETGRPVQISDAEARQELNNTFATHSGEIRALAFSHDGKHFVSASGDGEVKLWDATRLDEKQEPYPTLQARVPGQGLNVAVSPDGRRLATGGERNTVIIWDVESGVEILTLWGQHSGEVYAVAFSPIDGGRMIATAGEDSSVKIWDSHTGKLIHSFRGHEGLVSSLTFSTDGERLVSGSRDKTVKVWDMTRLND